MAAGADSGTIKGGARNDHDTNNTTTGAGQPRMPPNHNTVGHVDGAPHEADAATDDHARDATQVVLATQYPSDAEEQQVSDTLPDDDDVSGGVQAKRKRAANWHHNIQPAWFRVWFEVLRSGSREMKKGQQPYFAVGIAYGMYPACDDMMLGIVPPDLKVSHEELLAVTACAADVDISEMPAVKKTELCLMLAKQLQTDHKVANTAADDKKQTPEKEPDSLAAIDSAFKYSLRLIMEWVSGHFGVAVKTVWARFARDKAIELLANYVASSTGELKQNGRDGLAG